MAYKVSTRDVDCTTTRKYKTLAAARKRFEEMYGHTMEAAAAEAFYELLVPPRIELLGILRAVSDYGTVVTFIKEAE